MPRRRRTSRKMQWSINWLRVLKMLGGSSAGIAIILTAIMIAPSSIPGSTALRQLAATTLISLAVLEPTPAVVSATITTRTPTSLTTLNAQQAQVGETIIIAVAGTNFGWNYGSQIDPWFTSFIDNAALSLQSEQITGTGLSVTNATNLSATFVIPKTTSCGQWWSLKVISDAANNIEGILPNAIYIACIGEVQRTAAIVTAALAAGGGGGGGAPVSATSQSNPNTATVIDGSKPQVITKVAINNRTDDRTIVEIRLPAATVPKETTFEVRNIEPARELMPAPSGRTPTIAIMGNIIEITATNSGGAPVAWNGTNFIIKIETPDALKTMSRGQLQDYHLYYFDEIKRTWIIVDSAIIANDFITATINHLTKFTVLRTPTSLTIVPVMGPRQFFSRHLTLGMKGDDVTNLQKTLTEEKVYSGPITGYFGMLTQAGVKKYQKKYNITPQTGYVGPKTIAVLNAMLPATTATAPTPTPVTQTAKPPVLKQDATAASTLQKIILLLQELLNQMK